MSARLDRPLALLAAIAAVAGLALAALAAVLVDDSDAQRRRSCRAVPRGAETVVANSRGRVYRVVSRQPDQTVTRTYACLNRYRRHVPLRRDVRPSDGGGVFSYEHRLTSPFVAFVVAEENPTNGEIASADVRVVDARNGRVRRVSNEIEGGGIGVTDLELTRTASAAWINDRAGGGYEVHALDAGGQRLLDSGAIVPDSLTRNGQVVSWVRDGATQSAMLP